MRHIVLGSALVVLASACGAPTVEDLAKDPEKLSRTIVECASEIAGLSDMTEKCRNAMQAQQQLTNGMIEGIMGKSRD